MQLGLLSHGHLAFDPLKPVILRGLPTEDASTLFAGHVVLTLSKPTKISNVSVRFKSHMVTYWPEGIGTRGTKLTAEKLLGEQTVELLSPEKKKDLILTAGTHRFSFAFVIPNSTVATIEDTFGRVRHNVEAEVQRPGMMLLSNWRISKPVMVLRTYMSNSLLTNNSLANLSKTFEKHTVYGDIEVLIEAAAFSSGELFYIRLIIEPQLKHTRLEHMEVSVTETRRYCVPEFRAWRNDQVTFQMPFAGSVRLAEFGEVDVTTDQLMPIFDKQQNGIELIHDFAHRLAFFAPTCEQNIHHTTYIKEIQFRHRLEINLTLSYLDNEGHRQFISRSNSDSIGSTQVPEPFVLMPPPAAHLNTRTTGSLSAPNTSPSSSAPPSRPGSPVSTPTSWSDMLLRLNKTKAEKLEGRNRETITLDTPITVFDCRLKEDYGKLPSYFELGVQPTVSSINKKPTKPKFTATMDKPNQPHPYLCACYHAFCREMELASESLYLSSPAMPLMDRIPSIPPPDYQA